MAVSRRALWVAGAIAVAGALLFAVIRWTPASAGDSTASNDQREDAIARAQVWRAPAVPIGHATLGADASAPRALDCRFKLTDLGGTTPKFHCVLDRGTEIRAKYGRGEEIPAEAAATRLLNALGFGADRVALVERLRCYGCPRAPFTTMKIVEATRAQHVYEHVINHDNYQEFEWVAVEQKFDAPAIETLDQEGWAFWELEKIDPAKGGAPRAHVDALRLVAVFLAHWDNKAPNQRLVCLSRGWREDTPCAEPFLLLQDVGSTFGPTRVDLDGWERAPVWQDRATCTVSMHSLPYGGGTFGVARISEAGRQFLTTRLNALTDAQLVDLFSAARFDKQEGLLTAARPVSEWTRVFKARVKALTDGPPCPAQ
jgi:hypothetical protein